MISFTIEIAGTSALLMHNGRLADPLEPASKEVAKLSGKRKKTEQDHIDLARVEHLGGLYLDPDVGPFMPGENIARCLVDAGRMNRQGVAVTRGVFVNSDVNPLAYKGPRTAEGLWADANFQHRKVVAIGPRKIARCRPMFRQWSCSADGALDTNVLSLEDFELLIERAGMFIGLGDWRPRFGRFTASLAVTGELAA